MPLIAVLLGIIGTILFIRGLARILSIWAASIKHKATRGLYVFTLRQFQKCNVYLGGSEMQLQNEIVKKHTPIKSLLIDWLIIFGTYLFIRIFFALFGLHQNIVLLGCCLAILPYLFGALYLQKSHKQCQLWLAALAILIPSVVEKAAIYLFGAYLYNLRPINVVGVMEAIKSNAPYTNFIKNQSAQNLINLSYFNWTYILCSIAISVLVILLLHKTKQKSNKG